jgi:hypothetical protein
MKVRVSMLASELAHVEMLGTALRNDQPVRQGVCNR